MEEIRLGPIEWGVVTAHHLWGMGVRLEESGDDGVIVLDSIHDDFLDDDVTAYLGSKGVAATFVGLEGYQNGVMKLKMLPEFFDEFKEHIKSYPGVSGGWEVQLPHYKIERFNEMIVSSEWIPLIDAGDAGVFTLDGEWF